MRLNSDNPTLTISRNKGFQISENCIVCFCLYLLKCLCFVSAVCITN